jgi:hypothetical protein
MKVKQYVDCSWDPIPLLLIERHVPANTYPMRLPPKWEKTTGPNTECQAGQMYAGQQLVEIQHWASNIERMKKLYTKDTTAQFWLDFAEDIKNRVIPAILRPIDVDGPTQLEKLITFCKERDPGLVIFNFDLVVFNLFAQPVRD